MALITGAATRIGACMVRELHGAGFNLILHYRHSRQAAQHLAQELNQKRADSTHLYQADLLEDRAIENLASAALAPWGRLDVLINNASSFYPTPLAEATEEDWHDLMGSNLKAPFFLSRLLAPALTQQQGCLINICDVHIRAGLKNYSLYTMAKAGLAAMTRSLARELAPHVRVNAVAPGAILWPQQEEAMDDNERQAILNQICLGHLGTPDDIAKAVNFLIRDGSYITGQILAVDGGRSLNL